MVPALVGTISILLHSRSHALIAATVRNEATLALFISSCGELLSPATLTSSCRWPHRGPPPTGTHVFQQTHVLRLRRHGCHRGGEDPQDRPAATDLKRGRFARFGYRRQGTQWL